jgi:hypothetical protein
MHASAVPNRPTSSSRRPVQCVRHGRRHATSATAALAARSQESPAAGIDAKSRTATADPRYCEIAPRTKSVCGGILESRSMGDCVGATTGILPSVNVLVLAASPVDASLLRRELGDEVEGAQVLVVSPAVNSSPLAFWVSDSDEAIEDAQERLDETLEGLRAGGVQASGTTGDSEGIVALQDALATFQADRVVVVDDPDVADEASDRLDVPVTAVQST